MTNLNSGSRSTAARHPGEQRLEERRQLLLRLAQIVVANRHGTHGINRVRMGFAQHCRAQRVLRPGDTIVGTVRPGNGAYALVSEDGLTGSTGFAVLPAELWVAADDVLENDETDETP